MADRMAESGESTPGCDCGHDGMGVAWHPNSCAWRAAGSKRAIPKPCDCGRFDCDACLAAYLRRVGDAASGMTEHILGNLQGFAASFAAGLRESLVAKLPDDDKPLKPLRWCCNGNAEECALCDVSRLAYPWICPGNHENSPATRRTVLTTAADLGKEQLHETMARLRAWDAAADAEEHDEVDEAADKRLREAAERLPRTVRRVGRVPVQRTSAEDREGPLETSETVEPNFGLDAVAFRAFVGREILRVAIERTEREWICCEPVKEGHELCAKGHATVQMLTALFTDNEETFPPRSDVLDVVMNLVLGASAAGKRGTILAEAELRELYFKAVNNAVNQVVDWDGMDDLKPLKTRLLQVITTQVLTVRDRELQRLRQRLLLADDQHRQAILADMPPAEDKAVVEKRAHLEARLKALTELHDKLRSECTCPIEEIAFHNIFTWVNRELKSVKRMLDKPSQD